MNRFRRNFILGSAAFFMFPKLTNATITLVPGTTNIYDIGLKDLNPETPKQNCEQWCWAASLETIFSIAGYDVPQEYFVDAIFGRDPNGHLICAPANNSQMIKALRNTFNDATSGRRFEGRSHTILQSNSGITQTGWWQEIISELTAGRPLLAAYKTSVNSGHAVVITHMRIQFNNNSLNQIIGITVRDPWPATDSKIMLTVDQAKSISFVAAVTVKDI